MLRSLLPKAYHKFLSLPLLGPITDGFDDWLAASGYTPGSREFAIRMLTQVDADLRRRRVRDVASLTPTTLRACWRRLIKIFPTNAGTVRSLERYLVTAGVIAGGTETAGTSAPEVLSQEYANHLREVRGFAASTICHHRYASQCFLNHLKRNRSPSVRSSPRTWRHTSTKPASASAGPACNTTSLRYVVSYVFWQQMAGLPRDWIAGSTPRGFTGLSNCRVPFHGIQSRCY